MVRSQEFCRQILHNPQILHDLSLPSLSRLRMQGLRLPMSYLWRTKLTLQILLPFRSRLPMMSRPMSLGSNNLRIKAFLPSGALVRIIHIFIKHPQAFDLRWMIFTRWFVDESTNFRHVVSYNSHIDNDDSSDEHLMNDDHFLSAPKNSERTNSSLDFSVANQHSKKRIQLLAGRKYRKKYYNRLH